MPPHPIWPTPSRNGRTGLPRSGAPRRTRSPPTAATSPPSSISSPSIAALTAADFRAYLARRAMDNTKRTSIARSTSVLRGFFRFLDHRGFVHNAALAAVRTPKLASWTPKALSVGEMETVLDAAGDLARQP